MGATALSELKVRLALHDLGADLARFRRLLELPFSLVRLNSDLVAGCENAARGRDIVAAVVRLVRPMGLETLGAPRGLWPPDATRGRDRHSPDVPHL